MFCSMKNLFTTWLQLSLHFCTINYYCLYFLFQDDLPDGCLRSDSESVASADEKVPPLSPRQV